ncbi:MAG: phage portal protein [Agathobaculum sp.]|jgi:hypothetical protein|uniref:phage portal protein n=1 Tax=Agathobaculum sp. TaxID=2048138 RepID=UPI003D8E4DA9
MGLFDKLFPHRPPGGSPRAYFKTLTAYQPVYTTYRGGLYEMALTRAAVAAFARHCSKLHLGIAGDFRPELRPVLGQQPNPWMDASKFLARAATIYMVQNNAFIVPLEDAAGRLTGYYPVLPQQTSVREYGGQAYLQYEFWGGQQAAVELSRAGLLTQHQYEDDFFGSDNRPLAPTLQVMHTQDEGIVNGIKNATTIRFLARLSANLKPKDITAERRRFAEDNLAGNDTGVMMFDSKYADVKQIESAALVVNPKQQELIRGNVFEYFGTNEKILTNTYTEDEWNAYYEGCIEPFAIQLSLVLTAMTFTPEQIRAGAAVIATANRLQYASNNTKLNIVTQLFDRGFLTHNQGLEIFNMSPVSDGDRRFIRKEYAEVSDVSKLNTEPVEPKEGKGNGDHTGDS